MKLSVKLKVTLWFTVIMILLVSLVLAFIFKMGENIVFAEAQEKLQNTVSESFDEIKYRFGALDIDDNLDYYHDGVYISVYETDGRLIYGRLPSGFDRSLPFSENTFRTVGSGENAIYVFDLTRDVGRGYMVTVRGVLSAGSGEHAFSAMLHLAIIIFPAFIIIAAIVSYMITQRAFLPVKKIANAAENILSGNDLSKRISLGKGGDEIHKLAAEIDLMLDRLKNSFENEKRFTSDASHEFRTPIAVIIAETEAALENDEIQGEARVSLESIHAKALELSKIVSALLLLTRADRNHLKLNLESVDLSLLTETVAEQTCELALQKNIKVVTEIMPDVQIVGDETMLIRMLLNLCENGIKYGKQNGELNISLTADGEFAYGRVRDNGIGISAENLELIWERFFRIDEARSNGSGLGLPLAKYICQAHGGSMSASSERGVGSCFEFKIPIK